MSKVLIISPKGGCGKSTFAFQILAPFFFNKKKEKTIVVDLDQANNEHKSYSRSSIIELQENTINDLDPLLAVIKRNVIIDTGATTLALKALEKIDEIDLINSIDLFAIPITRGKQSTSSALDMYETIKELKSDAKICFILSDVYSTEEYPLEMQFIDFLGDKIHSTYLDHEQGKFDELKNSDPKISYLAIPQTPALYWSNQFGLTAYEFADKLSEIQAKREQLLDEVEKSPTKQADFKLSSYKVQLAKRCRNFRKNVLEDNLFKNLEQVLR